jgi:hypothetical protein
MRKLTSLVFLVMVLLTAAAVPANADIQCTAGVSIRDPFNGSLVDCLEADDGDCLSCRMIIVVGG